MIIVHNSLIPFKGYKALSIWPFVFVRKEYTLTETTLNHEKIHLMQQVEMLGIFFLFFYIVEWLIGLCVHGNMKDAYYSISFEKEAYINEDNLNYLKDRPLWSWVQYIGD